MIHFALIAAVAAAAVAPPTLVSAVPAAHATVAAPATIELRLSETLDPKRSGATLVMTGMPGMANHAPMRIPATSTIGADGATLILKPSKRLPTGSYRVDWHAASGDAARGVGTHIFSVK